MEGFSVSLAPWSRRFFRTSAMPLNQTETTPGGAAGPGTDITKTVKTPPPPTSFANPLSFQKYVPSAIDKHFLIWSGHYKSKSEIPNAVDKAVIDRARSWGRIRINLGFMVVGIIGAFVSVYMGKESWRRGESVSGGNLEWHRKVKEEHEQTLQQAKKT